MCWMSRLNTVIVIKHNLDVMKQADFLIDVGPDGGTASGKVIIIGTPMEITKHGDTITARYLRNAL